MNKEQRVKKYVKSSLASNYSKLRITVKMAQKFIKFLSSFLVVLQVS